MQPFILYSKCVRCKDKNVMKNRIYCDECLMDMEFIDVLDRQEEFSDIEDEIL